MASKPKTAATPSAAASFAPPLPDFEPEAYYLVKVSRLVSLGSMRLRPSASSIQLKGSVASEIKDAITYAERV